MKVWYVGMNDGCGSTSTAFFRNEPDLVALEEDDPESWACAELNSFEIPDGPNTIEFYD